MAETNSTARRLSKALTWRDVARILADQVEARERLEKAALPLPEPRNHVTEADQVRRTLGLLRSIIQSGERWTPGAQMEYGAALVSLDWLEREGKSSP